MQILTNSLIRIIRNSSRSISFNTYKMAAVQVGDKLPEKAELYEDTPANKLTSADFCTNKKVIIFGVPGAFTPGCSKTHLPGYVSNADKIKQEQGVQEIVCIAVNDPFVMSAWGTEHNTKGKVRMIADPSGGFVKALGLTVDLPPLGGLRSKRFSMIVDNCKITELNIEPDGTGLSCSLADNLGKKK